MRKIYFTEEQKKELTKYYLSGNSQLKTSKKFNICTTNVRTILVNNNIKIRTNSEIRKNKPLSKETRKNMSIARMGNKSGQKFYHTKEEVKKIIDMYFIKKVSMDNIGKVFGCGRSPVKRVLVENNLKTFRKGKISPRKNKTFEEIYGEEVAKIVKEKMSILGKGKHRSPKTEFKKGHITWIKNKKLPKEYKDKISKTRIERGVAKGEKNPAFNNWSSKKPYDKKWTHQFRNLVRKRDNNICLACNIHREKLKRALDVHHADYNKLNTFPQNCISLCRNCHAKTNFNREHWTKFFQSLLAERYGYEYSKEKEIIFTFGKY